MDAIQSFFTNKNWEAFPYQLEAMRALEDYKGVFINAPTGSGKTYAAFFAALNTLIKQNKIQKLPGLKILWITPLRALTKDITLSIQTVLQEMKLDLTVDFRTGDTSSYRKQKQRKVMPDILVTTPESLHVLISYIGREKTFKSLDSVVVDEWHELAGSKRGVLIQLGLAWLYNKYNNFNIIGISATVGNLEHASKALFGGYCTNWKIIRSNFEKNINITTLYPQKIETFSWAGHIGDRLAGQVAKEIETYSSSIIFTNTRRQTEIWYEILLKANPNFAGVLALHHGSLNTKTRKWVEESLRNNKLKAVVATSSLDLGIDFKPVEAVFQIGSPKSIARFLQRAGRSNHSPDKQSKIYIVPTNTLEFFDIAALRKAISNNKIEDLAISVQPFDVLVQFLITLAVGGGFIYTDTFRLLKSSYSFKELTREEFKWAVSMVTTGGESLKSYKEFKKVELKENVYTMPDGKKARKHRLSIGTITADPLLKVKYRNGMEIGVVEESFIGQLSVGDSFYFAGRKLLIRVIESDSVVVSNSKSNNVKTAAYYGSRIQLSTMYAEYLQAVIFRQNNESKEIQFLQPLIELQKERSRFLYKKELLIELFNSQEGLHLYMYPMFGRDTNQALALLLAYKLSKHMPATFSTAANDYGFELLSDNKEVIKQINKNIIVDILSSLNVQKDISNAMNISEWYKRHFKQVAQIAGIISKGIPGEQRSTRYIQSSANLYWDVFMQYDPENLLIKQTKNEVIQAFIKEDVLEHVIKTLKSKEITIYTIDKPTPLSFPIMVDRLRASISNEKLEDRIKKMLSKVETL